MQNLARKNSDLNPTVCVFWNRPYLPPAQSELANQTKAMRNQIQRPEHL